MFTDDTMWLDMFAYTHQPFYLLLNLTNKKQ